MSVTNLTDWRDGLCELLVAEAFNTDRETAIEACRRFESEWRRLSASELIAAREAELEADHRERLLELLRPASREAIA